MKTIILDRDDFKYSKLSMFDGFNNYVLKALNIPKKKWASIQRIKIQVNNFATINNQKKKVRSKTVENKLVIDMDESFTLIHDTQEIKAVGDSIGQDLNEYGCLFVEILDGDYGKIYGHIGFIPHNHSYVELIKE